MNPSEDPSDRLVDSLLREQARRSADEELLKSIEEKLDAVSPASAQAERPRSVLSNPAVIGALAAVVTLGMLILGSANMAMNKAKRSEQVAAPSYRESQLREQIVPENDLKELQRSVASAKPASPRITSSDAEGSLVVPDSSLKLETLEAPPAAAPAVSNQSFADNSGSGRGSGSAMGGPRHDLSQAPAKGDSKDIEQNMLLWGTPTAPSDALAGAAADSFVLPSEAPLAESLSEPEANELTQRSKNLPGKARARTDSGPSRENYGRLIDQPWKYPWQEALSTFSIDVDNASYTNIRRMIAEGRQIPADAVRIEELVNYFDYRYAGPQGDGPFAVTGDLATCPWKPGHLLARVAIKGKEIPNNSRPASNLVFLIDVSGSMQSPDKLPLLKRSIRVLIDQLDERDRVGMVVYAGTEGVVLEPTLLDERGKSQAIQALEKLEAGGSTNGGAGIQRAYQMAAKHLVQGGTNRVILATDGDFNVGTTGQGALVNLVKNGSGNRIYLSVLGFGTGNLNDAMLEAITKDGNGNYFYVDNDGEAQRVFLQKLTGTLVTIAKDVKIQVEFNPGKVKGYRLIGYANRILRHEDFNNDKVDAGDIGAGHTVTAFYEIVPDGVDMPATGSVDPLRYQKPLERDVVASDDWLTLKLRYKHPEGDNSSLIETTVKGEPVAWQQAGNDFRFASAVALFGMKLRQLPDVADVPWAKVESIARPGLADDAREQRSEFVSMVRKTGDYDPSVVEAEESTRMTPVWTAADLSFLEMRSTKWYVTFGLQSEGKWAPKLLGQDHLKKPFNNRVNPATMLNPGDTFFGDGAMQGRFKLIGFTEREVFSSLTGTSQNVQVAIYEDLSPGKLGKRYESQYGLLDAEIDAAAYADHSAVIAVKGSERTPLVIGEGSTFGANNRYLLKQVTADHASIEYTDQSGTLRLLNLPLQK
ncbi:von Willebrand factor type A domain-containing protein [Luteolibacter sp. GHJ8]|uniref:von Willebrand factor type A domain-containing protein n=1 Tax=Luteolibacter rhizosphaerae TaxID=2989719 RepID=A0ABT3FXY4_9BACT|nr:Amuc_1099 family pilus-like system protein [Luteolibacter rhizosphaerae]MCW1912432.1 von Willebrand factor type A domain-containing protein [Luteolibacter rhizosphaerae]